MSKYLKLSAFIRDKVFGKYLLVTNTVSGSLFMFAGDFIQQKIEYYRRAKEYDVERAKNMCAMGLLLGPLPHYIYKFLDTRWPKADTKSVLKKLAVDQLTIGPFCIVLFFATINLMEGKDLKKSWAEIKEKFLTVYLVDLVVWLPAQAINFFYLPARFRVIYMDGILLGYDVFLSYIKYKDQDDTKPMIQADKEKL